MLSLTWIRPNAGISGVLSTLFADDCTPGTPGYISSCAKGRVSPEEAFLLASSMDMSVCSSVFGSWVWREFVLRRLIALRTLRIAETREKSTKSIRNVGKHAAINAREHSTRLQYWIVDAAPVTLMSKLWWTDFQNLRYTAPVSANAKPLLETSWYIANLAMDAANDLWLVSQTISWKNWYHWQPTQQEYTCYSDLSSGAHTQSPHLYGDSVSKSRQMD